MRGNKFTEKKTLSTLYNTGGYTKHRKFMEMQTFVCNVIGQGFGRI